MTEPNMPSDEPRHIGGLLLLGLLAAAPVFVWFLLRPGFAKSTRISGFVYASVMLAFGLLRQFTMTHAVLG